MADKELRRIKRRDLLEMLLAQCEETERLQQEADEAKRQLAELMEGYERLKIKLNIKDERLNQKDAKIAELKRKMEVMRTSKAIELEEAGSIAEAAIRINGVFEAAQKAAEQYLMNVKMLSEREHLPEAPDQMHKKQIPFEYGRTGGIQKKMKKPRMRQIVPMKTGMSEEDFTEDQTQVVMAAASGDVHGS